MKSLLVLIALSFGASMHAQAPPPAFEVASVKPHVQGSGFIPLSCSNGRLTSMGYPLVLVIQWAYDLNTDQYRQIEEHLPKWLSPTTAFDITAAAERSVIESPVAESQCRLIARRGRLY